MDEILKIAESTARALSTEPERYRSIVIESRPIPEEWVLDA